MHISTSCSIRTSHCVKKESMNVSNAINIEKRIQKGIRHI